MEVARYNGNGQQQIIRGGQRMDEGFFEACAAALSMASYNLLGTSLLITGLFILLLEYHKVDGPFEEIQKHLAKRAEASSTAKFQATMIRVFNKLFDIFIGLKIEVAYVLLALGMWRQKPSRRWYLPYVIALAVMYITDSDPFVIITFTAAYYFLAKLRSPLHKTVVFTILVAVFIAFVMNFKADAIDGAPNVMYSHTPPRRTSYERDVHLLPHPMRITAGTETFDIRSYKMLVNGYVMMRTADGDYYSLDLNTTKVSRVQDGNFDHNSIYEYMPVEVGRVKGDNEFVRLMHLHSKFVHEQRKPDVKPPPEPQVTSTTPRPVIPGKALGTKQPQPTG